MPLLSLGGARAGSAPSKYAPENMAHNQKFKMAAVRHLGIVASSFRTTHEVSSLGHISLSNRILYLQGSNCPLLHRISSSLLTKRSALPCIRVRGLTDLCSCGGAS